METAHTRADWRAILRRWLNDKPSGFVFRSSVVYTWAQANIRLNPADIAIHHRSGRAMWRFHLSNAISDLHHAGDLIHPGCSHLAWMVP